MCFILHIATKRKIERISWKENDRHLCVEDIHGVPGHVRAHFSLPDVAYIGSSLGCGCGFRFVSFQNGDWPEEWMIEQGECERPDAHLEDHQALHDLVRSHLARDGYVELYGCWDGDEREKAEHEEEIPPSRIIDERFWFRERGLFRITAANQPVEATADPLSS